LRKSAGSYAAAALRAAAIIVVAFAAMLPSPASAAQYAGVVIDAKTGKTLYSHRADARQAPASLTKMMTLSMLFEAMDQGAVSKSTRIPVSKRAAAMQPSKLGVPAGGSVSAEQAILALVTRSANDIAAAVGEYLGGSESKFAEMMTRKARSLGMSQTTFKNASGLPAAGQLTTARDMATLGIALREHFPRHYGYFATRSFKYGKQRIGNHNRLLGVVSGVDGIKTGYTRASGFNLVSSVQRDGRSIVAVVLGGKSGKSRNQQMASLIKAHMPKASTGADRMLVARKGGNAPLVIAAAEAPEAPVAALPAKGPTPVFRVADGDGAGQRIAQAHASAAAEETFDVASIERKLRQLAATEVPVPSRAPAESRTDPIVTATSELAYAPQPVAAAPQAMVSGWQIQIGATPSRDAAMALLEKAREKAPGALSSVEFHTETVEKNGDTLYRARFAGFDSKDAAWAACGQLKKKKFACIALAN